MKNGCKFIFQLAKDAEKENAELNAKSVQHLAEKLVHFLEFKEASGDRLDPQNVADSLIRMMPSIKMVIVCSTSFILDSF